MDCKQILTDDIDLQVLLVGSPKMRPTNPRWRRAAILKNRHISAIVWPILTNFRMVMHLDLCTLPAIKIFRI